MNDVLTQKHYDIFIFFPYVLTYSGAKHGNLPVGLCKPSFRNDGLVSSQLGWPSYFRDQCTHVNAPRWRCSWTLSSGSILRIPIWVAYADNAGMRNQKSHIGATDISAYGWRVDGRPHACIGQIVAWREFQSNPIFRTARKMLDIQGTLYRYAAKQCCID